MNWERGFKRITLPVSIVVGLSAFLFSFGMFSSDWGNSHDIYKDSLNIHENIIRFWSVWHTTENASGKKSLVKQLLDSESEPSGAFFYDPEGLMRFVNPYDVFPGIHKDMLDMPLSVLEEKAQEAKRKANERNRKFLGESRYWGKKTPTEIVLLSIVASLPFGLIGFFIVWLLFYLIRWVVCGFCSDAG